MCGKMVRSVIRFRGTVRSIEPLGRRALTVNPVEVDVLYLLALEIASVEGPRVLRAVLDEADRQGVGVQRVSQGSGVMMLSDEELDEMLSRVGEALADVDRRIKEQLT